MGKGSGRRPKEISDEEFEKAWNAVFAGHPSEGQFETVKKDIVKRKEDAVNEDDYGNEIPYKVEPKKPKKEDPDRFVDETGDA
jgi:hypothetical protein